MTDVVGASAAAPPVIPSASSTSAIPSAMTTAPTCSTGRPNRLPSPAPLTTARRPSRVPTAPARRPPRRVAAELDTGPASLYAHVAHKEELLELVFDKVVGGIPLPEPDGARWQEQIRKLWTDSHAALAPNGDIARVALGRVPLGPRGAVRRGLPADRFPTIAALVPMLMSGDGQERFACRLDLIVRGLAAQAGVSGR